MLLPLNLKTSKSVALSIIKIGQSYSIKPCTIVNGFGMDKIDSSFWCLRKVNNRPFIYIHKRKDGYSKFSEDDFITAFPIDVIEDCLKLLL